MNRVVFTFIATMLSIVAWAQDLEPSVANVTGEYNRAAYSVVVIDRGGQYMPSLREWANGFTPKTQLDYNDIPTKLIIPGALAGSITTTEAAMWRMLDSSEAGHEIIAYLLNRNEKGEMDASIIEQRGLYNATAMQEQEAKAAALGRDAILKDMGYELMMNNYVLLMDYRDIVVSKNDYVTTYTAQVVGHLFKLNLTDSLVQDVIFDKMWIYPHDDESVRESKRAMFDELDVEFEQVQVVSNRVVTTSLEGGLPNLWQMGFNSVTYELEKREQDWIVQTTVLQDRPIKANIGRKEGLKNGQRFYSYRFEMNSKGEITPEKTAVLRATTIGNNTSDRSATSDFIQIAGYAVEPGYVLKQMNDKGLSTELGYRVGGFEGVALSFDKLLSINTSGRSDYIMGRLSVGSFNTKGIVGAYQEASSMLGVNLGVGYGSGFRFARYFEFVPHVMVVGDYLEPLTSVVDKPGATNTEVKFEDKLAFGFAAGVRLNINISYPVQLYAGVDYGVLVSQGDYYESYNDMLKISGKRRDDLGIGLGFRYTF